MESRLASLYDKMPVVAQNLLLSAYCIKLDHERYGGDFAKYKRFLDESQWYTPEKLREYQEQKLRELISYSYEHVKYYRRIMDERGLKPADIQGISDLQKLPVLTKQDIRNHFSDLLSDEYDLKTVKKGHTSGTTGSPLEVCYNDDLIYMNYAMMDRQYEWIGVKLKRFGDRIAVARGNVIVPLSQSRPPFWRNNYYHNQLLLSSFHMSRQNLKYYIEELERFKPRVLDGYPSTTYILAKYLRDNNKKIKLDAVITSSETLYDFQREVIEDSFQCKIFDYYAAAERVLFSTECDRHGGHHIADEYGITEVVDDNYMQLEAGKTGYMVATGLHNRAMPLIRYLTNDMSAIKPTMCSCGRGLSLMEDVTTKAEDILTLKDGRLISPSVLTHPFKPLTSIIESQVIQEDIDNLCIKLVVGPEFVEDDEQQLIHAFEERLGTDINIRVEKVDALQRTRSGKFKWVISNVKPGI